MPVPCIVSLRVSARPDRARTRHDASTTHMRYVTSTHHGRRFATARGALRGRAATARGALTLVPPGAGAPIVMHSLHQALRQAILSTKSTHLISADGWIAWRRAREAGARGVPQQWRAPATTGRRRGPLRLSLQIKRHWRLRRRWRAGEAPGRMCVDRALLHSRLPRTELKRACRAYRSTCGSRHRRGWQLYSADA